MALSDMEFVEHFLEGQNMCSLTALVLKIYFL